MDTNDINLKIKRLKIKLRTLTDKENILLNAGLSATSIQSATKAQEKRARVEQKIIRLETLKQQTNMEVF